MPRVETHSLAALLTFCLPIGLSTYWIFQGAIKSPILEVLPDGPYARWRPFAAEADIRSLRQWAMASVGVLGGALTHLIWDAFTHEGGRGVRMFPVLDDSLIDIGNRHIPAMYVLQDLGSLIGLAAVLAMLCWGLRRGHDAPVLKRLLASRERVMWWLIYALAGGVFTAGFYAWARLGQPPMHYMILRVSAIAIASVRGLAAALLCVSVALDLRLHQLHQRSSGPDG